MIFITFKQNAQFKYFLGGTLSISQKKSINSIFYVNFTHFFTFPLAVKVKVVR